MECFFGSACRIHTPCRPGHDWKCNHCQAQWHYICEEKPRRSGYKCVKCGTLMHDCIVSYWATSTYETVANRANAIYDVNYVYKGNVAIVLPYRHLADDSWTSLRPFVASDLCLYSMEGETWAKEHFEEIVKRLGLEVEVA